MTIKEFEKSIEQVKGFEKRIKRLEDYVEEIKVLNTDDTSIVLYYDEDAEENVDFGFPNKCILKMAKEHLEEEKNAYKEAIEKLNQCGLNIEIDKDILGE